MCRRGTIKPALPSEGGEQAGSNLLKLEYAKTICSNASSAAFPMRPSRERGTGPEGYGRVVSHVVLALFLRGCKQPNLSSAFCDCKVTPFFFSSQSRRLFLTLLTSWEATGRPFRPDSVPSLPSFFVGERVGFLDGAEEKFACTQFHLKSTEEILHATEQGCPCHCCFAGWFRNRSGRKKSGAESEISAPLGCRVILPRAGETP